MQHSKDSGKHRVGVGLSLDKFAGAKVSKYNKKAILEHERTRKQWKYSKYQRLKHRLEVEGKLQPLPFKDTVAELEQLDQPDQDAGIAPGDTEVHQQPHSKQKHHSHQDHQQEQQPHKKQKQHHHKHQQQEEHEPLQLQQAQQQTLPVQHKGKHKHAKHPSRLQKYADEIQAKRQDEQRAKEEARKAKEERQAKIEAVQKARKQEKAEFYKKTRRGQPVMKTRINKILDKLQSGAF